MQEVLRSCIKFAPMKAAILAWLIPVIILMGLFACGEKTKPIEGRYYSGLLFGKPYTIDVVGDSKDYQTQIDSIIRDFEKHFNSLDTSSTIARYNAFARRDVLFEFVDTNRVFGNVYDVMRDLNMQTMRYYDPTVNPLKTAWMVAKFNGGGEPNLDSLFQFVGFDGAKMDLIEMTGDNYEYIKSLLKKSDPRLEADFTNLAMAMALDYIGDFFRSKNIPQFRIKCGQSTICHGNLVDSLTYVPMGIINNSTDQLIRLTNAAFTSKTTKEKVTLVDPTYGYPVDNEMAYVAVSAPTLAQCEAFSEAFMIMGIEQASQYYTANEESRIQSFIFYKEEDNELHSASTEGFDRLIMVRDSTAQ